MTATTTNAAPRATALAHTRFYLWMAVAMAATAFLGFAPTFWAPLAQGVPERIAVLAIHGALFFGWTLFLI
jgi:formate/nitrite transporter FocA (FNT family)